MLSACKINTTDTLDSNPYLRYWTFSHSGGTSIDYALIQPEVADPNKSYPLLLILPPGEQKISQVDWTIQKYIIQESIQRGWIVVCPASPNDKLFYTGNETYLPELLNSLENLYSIEGGKFHLAGISNGGKSAFRLALDYPDRFQSLVTFPGIPPEQSDFQKLNVLSGMHIAMYIGINDDDTWINAFDQTTTAMDNQGVNYQARILANNGHVINSITPGFLFDLLDSYRN